MTVIQLMGNSKFPRDVNQPIHYMIHKSAKISIQKKSFASMMGNNAKNCHLVNEPQMLHNRGSATPLFLDQG